MGTSPQPLRISRTNIILPQQLRSIWLGVRLEECWQARVSSRQSQAASHPDGRASAALVRGGRGPGTDRGSHLRQDGPWVTTQPYTTALTVPGLERVFPGPIIPQRGKAEKLNEMHLIR